MHKLTNFLKYFSFKLTPGSIIIFLIIFQSCGIDLFPKKGTILIFIVLFLCRTGFKYLTAAHFKNILLIVFFLVLNKLLNPAFETSKLFYQIGLVFQSYVFLLYYKPKGVEKLITDFYNALNIIFIHALLGYMLYLSLPFAFANAGFSYPYKTFFYLFYVAGEGEGAMRNCGLMWEPGLLQLMLNLLLFYSILNNRANVFLLVVSIVIITTFSTSGYFCFALNYLFFIFHNIKTRRRFVLILLFFTLISSSALLFIWSNITDKLGGENLSGLARYRDLYIGIELIKEKPLIGHGLYEETYLYTKPYVDQIQVKLFGQGILDIIGNVSGGYVNGFLDIFAWFGIPAGCLIFFCFFKNTFIAGLIYQRIIFFAIMCFTFFAEPITYTSFFLIFPFSYIIYKKSGNDKYNPYNLLA